MLRIRTMIPRTKKKCDPSPRPSVSEICKAPPPQLFSPTGKPKNSQGVHVKGVKLVRRCCWLCRSSTQTPSAPSCCKQSNWQICRLSVCFRSFRVYRRPAFHSRFPDWMNSLYLLDMVVWHVTAWVQVVATHNFHFLVKKAMHAFIICALFFVKWHCLPLNHFGSLFIKMLLH